MSARRSSDLLIVMLALTGVAVCAAAALAAASGPSGESVDRAVRQALIVGAPLAAGLYALRSPATRRFGFALLGAALIWSLTALARSDESLAYSIGRVSGWLVFPLLFFVLLAFPDGRMTGRDRRLLRASIVLIATLFVGSAPFVEAYPVYSPWAGCTSDCPANAFLVLGHEPAFISSLVEPVRDAAAVVVLAAVSATLVARLHGASRVRRPLLAPVAVMGVISSVVLAAGLILRRVAGSHEVVTTLGTIWTLCIPAIAVAFLIGLRERRLVVGSVLERLISLLDGDPDGPRLRTAVAMALDDDSADLLVADTAPGHWRDTAGRAVSPPAAVAGGKAVTIIGDADVPLAALVHEPALADDDELLGALSRIVLDALRQERLRSQLTRSLSELEESRNRIAAEADRERSRIERDLHDGAQQRLIKLRITLSLVEELVATDPEGAAESLRELGDEVEQTLDELRALAHGVYPSILSDRGLEDALRSLAVPSPIPVQLDVRGVTRLPPEIETAVYFTCAEALQNAVKHAGRARRISISLRQHDGVLRLSVRDDGAGFVPPAEPARGGGGLRNMADRLAAAGGRLTIDSTPGHGTRIRGHVPLRGGAEAQNAPPAARSPASSWSRSSRAVL